MNVLVDRPARHVVHFYRDDGDLGERAATYLAIPLLAGGRAAIIATPGHRDEILAHLAARGLDLERLRAARRLMIFDASDVMEHVVTPDGLDEASLRANVVPQLELERTGGTPFRVYSEVVDLLTRQGRLDDALRLERIWEDILQGYECEVLCGYSASHVAEMSSGPAPSVLGDTLIDPVSAEATDMSGAMVAVAMLRHEVRTLKAEVADRRELERGLRRMHGDLLRARRLEAAAAVAGGIAHHYNNLMCVIEGYAQLLQESLVEPELQAQAREISAAAERVNALTRQMLHFSSPQRNQGGQVEPDASLRSLWPMARHRVPATIEMELYPDAAGRCVALGAGELELVMLALVHNAQEAMPAGGRLTVTTRTVGPAESPVATASTFREAVVLEVADTGVGMVEAVRARAFEPFFTTHGLATSSGLGLSSVHGLVTAAGGRVTLESAPDRGTKVRIDLPVISALTRPLRLPAPAKAIAKVVMVVEDEEAVRRMVAAALRKQGYRVLEASCGNQAIQLLELFTERVDLVLADVLMPDMDGPALIQRARERHGEVPVLFMSGRHEAQDGRIDGPLINKPFTTRQLVRAVEDELERQG